MIEGIQNQISPLKVESRSVDSKSAVQAPAREAKTSPISALFPQGDSLDIGDGSKVVRDAMERVNQGLPAGGFDEVPADIKSLPAKLGPIMHHIVALMVGSSGDRLREIAKEAQEALGKISGDVIAEAKSAAQEAYDPSPGAIQKRVREMKLAAEGKIESQKLKKCGRINSAGHFFFVLCSWAWL